MATIHKDSLDMMEKDAASGTLEKSKILNCLFWKSNDIYDPVAMIGQSIDQPHADNGQHSRQSSQPNVTDSVLDLLDKHALWKCLSVPSDDDGCEYCTLQPIEMQLFPKHHIYTNGKLSCPLLLARETCV
ncbi:uncharacterized protein LOC128709806 [Anopheles marshallii]|uniref:uncharacterized protein LOC128709806 n=1 Tax=Anopheles marshallii TaxID=1521116 RepID=UPI00237A71AB|nr:uncharacterized protein LOC128709806 [Anopheles marshallii]